MERALLRSEAGSSGPYINAREVCMAVELEPGDGTSARFLGSWKLPFAFQRNFFPTGVFFDSALAHMSPPNRSDGSRRAYACIYGAAEMQYSAPEDAMRTDTVAGAAPSYHFEAIPSQFKL